MYPFHDLNVLLENSLPAMLHFPAPVVSQSLNIYCMSSKTDLPWEISKLQLWSIYLSATLFWRQETTQDEHRRDDDCGMCYCGTLMNTFGNIENAQWDNGFGKALMRLERSLWVMCLVSVMHGRHGSTLCDLLVKWPMSPVVLPWPVDNFDSQFLPVKYAVSFLSFADRLT